MREQGIRMKFNPLAEVAGKRLVVVDDSIVRGSTTRQIVAMLFDAGAAEVHVRVSSPPVVSPCFYGIDLASEDEMIAAHATVEDVRAAIGATSLGYISLDGLQACDAPARRRALPCVPDAGVSDASADGDRQAPLRVGLVAPVANDSPRRPSRPAARPVGRPSRSSSTRSVPSTDRSGSSVRSCSLTSSAGSPSRSFEECRGCTDEGGCLLVVSPRLAREIPAEPSR